MTRLARASVVPTHYKTEVNPESPITTLDAFAVDGRRSTPVGHAVTVKRGAVPGGQPRFG